MSPGLHPLVDFDHPTRRRRWVEVDYRGPSICLGTVERTMNSFRSLDLKIYVKDYNFNSKFLKCL